LDRIDKNILHWLQRDASLSVAELAEKVGLSSTPCWRRVQQLEKAGIITRRVALVDPRKINLGITAFVRVRTNRHDTDWLETFAQAADRIPEIVEVHRLSADVSANFAMEEIKSTTALPLDYA
jgi:Lrp/AsnC family transcriptional regulator